jgi:hypothetical protein
VISLFSETAVLGLTVYSSAVDRRRSMVYDINRSLVVRAADHISPFVSTV